MKSSRNIHPCEANGKTQTWHPEDLGAECTVMPDEIQKDQLRAIFQRDADSTGNQPDCRQALYRGGTGQRFNAWQPGEMPSKTDDLRKVEWTFIGPAGAPPQTISEPKKFEFEAFEEDIPEPEQPEEPDPSVLEQARLQAEEIILAAQKEADQILSQAQTEIEEQKKEAYQLGREQAIAELKDVLKASRVMLEEVQVWKGELMGQGERILVEMLVEMAQKMFGEGVELSPEALQINLNHVMENAQGLGDLKIFLNPRDAKLLDSSWSEYQMLVTGDKVKVIPSGRITVGGCYIKGNMGNVDGRVETQLDAVLNMFKEESERAE